MTNSRDSYFDNAKFLLIFLVVFGHIIRSYINDNDVLLHIYKFIYTFHMPAFILISGYFAKGFNRPGYVKKIAVKLIVPYLIFQGIYTVFYSFIDDQSVTAFNPFEPQWSLWFLLSLFFWNLFLFPFTKLPAAWSFAASLAIAVLVGYIDAVSDTLSLSRTFVFFPVFLAGFYLKREHFKKLKAWKGKQAALAVLAATFVFYFFVDFDYSWLFGSKPYSEFGAVGMKSALNRVALLVLTFASTFGFMALVPEKRYFFTLWGTRTFYVYLLHGFIIKSFRKTGAEEWLADYQSLTVLIIATAVLTFFLSSGFVKTLAQPFIELKMTNLLRWLKKQARYNV
ncbi:acyltransferase [Bacillus glycinifermentans]|uniref:acyltransferase family protein n=1 Tax=Bacillus glycinifermentans TaxID=1664069 RepID=UPI000652F6BF|nr:acyltransferase family protein [Bacillus glycinifermentans]KMM58080.1 acyltransferase [Bacillus glycinifermentans]MEC0495276.1 acyltransferase family protein [Bacillus glycinifermentans]MEC0540491.1 acyltransferase family protein [Bacillus glycinifermentans]